jgi:hypothetical protein
MVPSQALGEIERQVRQLPREDQLWLIERLAHELRRQNTLKPSSDELQAMADDPEIQRELRAISEEFSPTESDGLGPED